VSNRIHQGLQLPAHKQQTRDVAIISALVPDVLILPLNQHSDAELFPCVEIGTAVLKGQLIAQPASPLSACLHSPVSGRVLAIEPRATPQRSALDQEQVAALSIVIGNDHLDTLDTSHAPIHDWPNLEPLQLCSLLAQGGIAGLGGAVFSTATKLAAHTQRPIDCLLINGVECEPYISCDDRLMRERAGQIVYGAQILLHAAKAEHCIIAVEADKPEAFTAMQAALDGIKDARITISNIATAYPSGDEGQLITQLLGREVPRAALPATIGVIVQNVATAYACARWIGDGEPLISRIVTVTGPGIHQPANLEVRLGTLVSDVLAACGGCNTKAGVDTLIMGGVMMGRALAHDQLPIVKASNCLIVGAQTSLKPPAAEMPCIRCGECAEACPVHLLPQQLLAFTRSNNRSALHDLGLSDCIECGCCDYVCPSNITLAARFHIAKRHQT
jgi:H+/Na+-translocating ferredoxin:NAD+ oxidoreductase subunit C